MRKAFVLLVFAVAMHPVFSQVSAGPKAGLNFSSVIGGSRDEDNSFKLGFYCGFFMNLSINDKLSIQPEVLYSTRGFKYQRTIGNNDTSLSHNLSYIDFPFLGSYLITDRLSVEAGPQIGYIIADRTKGTAGPLSSAQEIDTSTVLGFNTTEYSVAVGAGFIAPYGITANIRFVYGLTKLYSNGDFSHNISFGINVSYSFGTGRSSPTGRGGIYRTL